MNFTQITKVFLLAPVLLVFTGCKDIKEGGSDEGVIEFVTSPVNKSDPLFELAPSKATMKFKKDKFLVQMSVMGIFNTSLFSDSKAKTLTQTVKFMNIRQYCVENATDLEAENKANALSFEETGETKKIAGLKCYRLKVTNLSAPGETFDAWYTRELGNPDCNVLTPYAPVKGVMMDYRIKKMGLEMHFVASKFSNEQVPDETFRVTENLKEVSREEMSKLFAEL